MDQVNIDVLDGTVFLKVKGHSLAPIDEEHVLSSTDVIWAASDARYVINTTSGPQLIETDCVSCVRLDDSGDVLLTQLKSMNDVDIDELKNSQLTDKDIAIIRAHMPPPAQDPNAENEQVDNDVDAEQDEGAQDEPLSLVQTASAGFVEVEYDEDAVLTKAGFDTQGFFEDEVFLDDEDDGIPIVMAPGGEIASITLTEADLDPLGYNSRGDYPVIMQQSVLVEARTLALQPETFTFEPQSLASLLQELNAELTSGGQALSFVFDADSNAIIGTLDGEVYLTIQLNVSSPDGRDVQIDVEVNLAKPLDHLAEANSTGLVSNINDQITINLAIQGQDAGSNPLNDPISVDITINDGVLPSFGTDPGIVIDESTDLGVPINGQVPVDIGSDQIDSLRINFNQPVLDGITSQSFPIHYETDGKVLTVYNILNEVVFTLELSDDGSYVATLFHPFDQGSSQNALAGFAITATDKDGDVVNGVINITAKDGEVDTGGETGSLTIIEPDTAPNEYPIVGETHVFVAPGSDRLVANTVQFDSTQIGDLLTELSSELTTANGGAITFDFKEGDDTVIEGYDSEGNLVLSIALDGSAFFLGAEITVTVTQHQPLDHFASGDSSGLVMMDGDQIKINTAIQIEESDGTLLDTPVNVDVTISDGDSPQLSTGDLAEFIETSTGGYAEGSVALDAGSDDIDRFEFNAEQPTLDGLMTNDVATEYLVTGNQIIVYIPGDEANPILTITIQNDGTFEVTQTAALEQANNPDDTIHLQLDVTAFDKDGDQSNSGQALIDIIDGQDPTGTGTTVDITEGDLSPVAGYPADGSGTFTLNQITDKLIASTFVIEETVLDTLQTELEALTANGSELTITISKDDTTGEITIIATSVDTTEEVLLIVLTPTENANGNVDVGISVLQNYPLDHVDTSGDYVSIVDDVLTITIPVQIEDADGDVLVDANGDPTPVDVVVTINDGQDPEFNVSSQATELTEGEAGSTGVISDGLELELDTNSDEIDAITFNLTDAQAQALLDITSNGQETRVDLSVEGRIFVYIPAEFGGSDIPVLEIIFDNNAKDGSYTIQQYQPIDQPENTDTASFEFDVVATDMDGDTAESSIIVTINDGNDPTSDGFDTSISISEGNLNDNGQSLLYPNNPETIASFTINSVNDDLDPTTLTIDDYASFKATLESMNLSSNGRAISIDNDMVVNDEGVITITGMAEGSVVFILILTPTVDANGNVTVVMSLEQKQPLDHLDSNSISFDVPIQISDTDGDKLVGSDGLTDTPIDINVSFTDGEAPILIDTTTNITEADVGITDPQIYTGQVPIDIGSDTVASMQFVSDGQKGAATGLLSNDQLVLVDNTESGVARYYYLGGESGTEEINVLVITLTEVDGVYDGSYQVEQYEPLEQSNDDDDITSITLEVFVTDHDGDPSENATITINIADGTNPQFVEDSSNVILNESTDNGVTNSDGQVTITVGSDDVETIQFAPEDAQLDDDGNLTGLILTSNGELTSWTIDDYSATLFASDGTTALIQVTIDDTGAYTMTVLGPIDQADSELTQIELGLIATDTDGDTADGSLVFSVEDGLNAQGVETGDLSVIEATLPSAGASYDPAPTANTGNIPVAAGVEKLDPDTVQIKPSDLATLKAELEADLTSGGQSIVFQYDEATATLTGYLNGDESTPAITIVLTAVPNGQGVDINVIMTQHLPLDHEQDASGANSSGWVTVNDTEIHINLPVQVQDTDGDYLDSAVEVDLTIIDGANPTFTVDSGVVVDEAAIDAGGENHQGSSPTSDTETASGQINIALGSDDIDTFKIDADAFSDLNPDLTSQGVAVIMVENSDGTFSGMAGDREVFIVTFSPGGSYSFTITGALDHEAPDESDPSIGTQLDIQLPIYAVDNDGDQIPNSGNFDDAIITVTVNDDVPTIEGNTFNVNEGEAISTSLSASSEGADDINARYMVINGVEHEAPFTDIEVYQFENAAGDGPDINSLLLGTMSLDQDGNVTFVTNGDLPSEEASISKEFEIQVVDKDGDVSTGIGTLVIHDKEPSISTDIAVGQEEDGRTPSEFDNTDGTDHSDSGIPISMSVDLGDVDRGEILNALTITLPENAHGQFFLEGIGLLTPDANGVVTVDNSAFVGPDVNGVVTINGLQFIPETDYSTDEIHFTVNAEVTTTDGEPSREVPGELVISVKGIADIPVWNEATVTEYIGTEDNAIAIDGLLADLNDEDGSERLYYIIQIAEDSSGTIKGTGLEQITLADGSTAYRVSESNLGSLTVTPDKDFSGDIHLNAWAQSEEQGTAVSGKETADSVPIDIVVRVQPDADEDLTLKVTRVESDEDVAINLSEHISLNHPSDAADGSETLYVRISNLPTGAQLLLNGEPVSLEADGSYEILYSDLSQLEFLPAPESSGDFTLTVEGIVRDNTTFEGTTTATDNDEYITISKDISISVAGVADEPIISINDGSGWTPINLNPDDQTSDGVEITIQEDGIATFDFDIISGESIDALDGDDSEILSVVISGIPEGLTVMSNGTELELTYVGQDENGQPIYQIELDSLNNIQVEPPLNSTEDIELTASIVVTEADGDSAVYEKDIVIHVEPVIDLGDTYTSESNGFEDQLVTLNWKPTFSDPQEYVTSFTLILPDGADTDGYSIYIVEAGGAQTQLFFDSEGSLNLDAYLEQLDNGAELKISMPPNSDKDFELTTNITVQQDDVDQADNEAVKNNIIGTLVVNVDAKVEESGNPYEDDTTDGGVGKIVISNGLDENSDGIVDDIGTVPCDENGVVNLSSSGVGTIMFAENDLSSDEIITELIIDFSGISLPEGQGFVVTGAVNNGDGSWTVKDGNLSNIQIQAPASFTDTVDIKVVAKVVDQGDNNEGDVSQEASITGEISLDFSNNTNDSLELAAEIIVEDTVVTGSEDQGINLGSQILSNNAVSASTDDQNGDEESEIPNDVMTVVIDASDLPAGATITGAEYDFETGQYVYEATLNPDGTVNLSGLGLIPPPDYAGDFQFDIKYVNTDTESGDVKEATQTITVNVSPVADTGASLAIEVVESKDLADKPVSNTGEQIEPPYNGIAYEDSTIVLDFSNITVGDSRNTVEEGLETVVSLTIKVDPLMGYFLDANGYLVSELTLGPTELASVEFIPLEDFSGQVDFTVSGVITDTATFNLDSNRTETDTRETEEITVSIDVIAVNDDVLVESNTGGNIQGNEDTPGGISLAAGSVTLQDIDDSEEIVSIVLTGIPDGFIVQGAANNGDGSWTISDATGEQSYSFDNLSLIPPKNFSGTIEVGVVVYTKEQSLDNIAAISDSITVEVLPVADEIDTDVVTNAVGTEGENITLSLDISTVDNKPSSTLDSENGSETIQITISNVPVDMGASFSFPDGVTGTIVDNGDGTWAITTDSGQLDSLIFNPGDANSNNWDGQLELDIRAVDNGVVAEDPLSEQATITVDVTPVNDAPENTVPAETLAAVEGEPILIEGLAIFDVDAPEGGQMTVTLATANGLLSVPDEYSGSVTIDGNASGSLSLSGSLVAINELLSGGIEYVPETDGDATITMTTTDNGNTGTGGELTDTDEISVSVAPAAVMMASFASSRMVVPNVSSTAAQLALIPLLGLLSEHVQAFEAEFIKINNLDSGKVVDASGQALGDQQDDGSWIIASQDLSNAYLADLEEGQHNLTVEAASQDTENDELISESQPIAVNVTIEPEGQDVRQANNATEHSVVVGDNSDETLIGTEGHDTLIGGLGNDILVGAGGSDVLIGGAGNDELWGGERNGTGDGAADAFVWRSQDIGTQTTPSVDVIKDFELSLDKLDVRDLFSNNDASKAQMEEILSHITASEDDGKINLTVNTDKGGEQVIVLDNISTHSLGLDSGASSSDIVSSLYAQHNAFMSEHNS